jgi:hypothetical protein
MTPLLIYMIFHPDMSHLSETLVRTFVAMLVHVLTWICRGVYQQGTVLDQDRASASG